MKTIPIERCKELIDQQGNIYLNDKFGISEFVCSIKHGITFDLPTAKAKSASKAIIYTSNSLADEFFFDEDGLFLFHHLQTRHLIPNLTKTYLQYFLDVENICAESFFLYVYMKYFKVLGYTFPEAINADNKAE